MAGEVKIIKGIAAAAALAAALALCLLLAQDTEPPQVTTKTVTVRHYEDGVDTDGARTEPYSAADFIDTYTDNRKGKAFTVQYGEGYLDFQEPGQGIRWGECRCLRGMDPFPAPLPKHGRPRFYADWYWQVHPGRHHLLGPVVCKRRHCRGIAILLKEEGNPANWIKIPPKCVEPGKIITETIVILGKSMLQ